MGIDTEIKGGNSRLMGKFSYLLNIRWPSIRNMHGEGLALFCTNEQQQNDRFVIVIPDADQTPEMLCGVWSVRASYAVHVVYAAQAL